MEAAKTRVEAGSGNLFALIKKELFLKQLLDNAATKLACSSLTLLRPFKVPVFLENFT